MTLSVEDKDGNGKDKDGNPVRKKQNVCFSSKLKRFSKGLKSTTIEIFDRHGELEYTEVVVL